MINSDSVPECFPRRHGQQELQRRLVVKRGASSDRGHQFHLQVQNRERDQANRVSGWVLQAGCTTVISKSGGCSVVTPLGQVIALDRRQRTHCLKGRIGVGGELEVLTVAAMKRSPEFPGLPVEGRGRQIQTRQWTSQRRRQP